MSLPRFTPHSLYRVLLESEITKYHSCRFGQPLVCGEISRTMKIIPFRNFCEMSYTCQDHITLIPELENPRIMIHPRISVDEEAKKQPASPTDEYIKRKGGFQLQYPISSDIDHPITDALIRSATQINFNDGASATSDGGTSKMRATAKAHEIHHDQVEFLEKDKFEGLARLVACSASYNMGVIEEELHKVKVRFRKILVFEEGDFIPPRKDEATDGNHFGTLMIQLPTTELSGGLISADHQERAIQADISTNITASFAAWFNDVKYQMKPIESGLRVVLMFDMFIDDDFRVDDLNFGKNHNIPLSSDALASLMHNSTVKAFKKMVTSNSFLYPELCMHGFLLSEDYDTDHFNEFNPGLKFNDRKRVNFMKMVANEAYGTNQYEMGLFNLTLLVCEEEDDFNISLRFSPKFDECIHQGEIYYSSKASFDWIAQRIYPMQDMLYDSENWNTIYGFDPRQCGIRTPQKEKLEKWCILMWPRRVSLLVRNGYLISFNDFEEKIRSRVANYSICDLMHRHFEVEKLKEKINKLIADMKACDNEDIKAKIYEDIITYLILLLYKEDYSKNSVNRLKFLEEKGIAIEHLVDRIMIINPYTWLEVIDEWIVQGLLTGNYTLRSKITSDFVKLFSNDVIGKMVGKEANEAINRLLGWNVKVLSKFFAIDALLKEEKLKILGATGDFFVEYAYFVKYPLIEIKYSKLTPYLGLNNYGNVNKDDFQGLLDLDYDDCDTDALSHEKMNVVRYLEQDLSKVNLDYAVANAWTEFFITEMETFENEFSNSSLSVFVRQFRHFVPYNNDSDEE